MGSGTKGARLKNDGWENPITNTNTAGEKIFHRYDGETAGLVTGDDF
jgi:hypothetical protein